MVQSQADCLSLYWSTKNIDLNFLSGKVALQGNLNPEILLQEDSIIKIETNKILDKFKGYQGYIFNLGHGITQFTPPENLDALLETVRNYSPKYHQD